MSLSLLLALAGCAAPEEGAAPAAVTITEADLDLVVTLEYAEVAAGRPVGWLAYLEGAAEPIPIEQVHFRSDLEPQLYVDDEALHPTVAGEHRIVAEASLGEASWSVELPLVVHPDVAARLDLVLDDVAVEAGEPLGYALVAEDAWGNAASVEDAVLEPGDGTVEVEADGLRSTVAGVHEVTARLGELEDTAAFTVLPGPVATFRLTIDDTDLELGEATVARVEASDAWGNPVEADWPIWSDPAGVRVDGSVLTFEQEGVFTIYASTPDGALSDAVGPLTVDSTGPLLEVDDPPRGAELGGTTIAVAGSVSDEWTGVADLAVGGQAVAPDGAGAFSATVPAAFGLNVIETVATDGDGNRTSDLRSALVGDFLPYGDTLPDGIVARITEPGFTALEAATADVLDEALLGAELPDTLYSDSSEDFLGNEWYALTVRLGEVSMGPTTLSIDPMSTGQLRVTLTMLTLWVNYAIDAVLLYIPYEADGFIESDVVEVVADLRPSVSGGSLHVDVDDVSVTLTGYSFDLDSIFYDVASFFGVDIDGMVHDEIVAAIEDTVRSEVPAMVEDLLGSIDTSTSFALGDATVELATEFSSVSVDDEGMTLGLGTRVTVDGAAAPAGSTGSLAYGYAQPGWSGRTEEFLVGLSLDFFNQVLYATWVAGVLDQSVAASDLGLSAEELGLVLGEATDPFFLLDPLLPPVVVPGSGDALLDFGLGDLRLAITEGDPGAGAVLLDLYAAITGAMDLEEADGALALAMDTPQVRFDLAGQAGRSRYAEQAEAFLVDLVPVLVPDLAGGLDALPLPEIEGFDLGASTPVLDGPESGYLLVAGDLELLAGP